jgi:hypothetical protein
MAKYEDDEYEKRLKALLKMFLTNALKEQAERIWTLITERKKILVKRKELEKQVGAASPIMTNYTDKVKNLLEIHTKVMDGLGKVEDPKLSLFLLNTFNEYVEARNIEHMEFITLAKLRRMDDLEHLVSSDNKTGGK